MISLNVGKYKMKKINNKIKLILHYKSSPLMGFSVIMKQIIEIDNNKVKDPNW